MPGVIVRVSFREKLTEQVTMLSVSGERKVGLWQLPSQAKITRETLIQTHIAHVIIWLGVEV